LENKTSIKFSDRISENKDKMSKKRTRDRKTFKKGKTNTDSIVESDEYVGFIVGYTSNGVPYGLTHEEWDELNSETEKNKSENDSTDLPF